MKKCIKITLGIVIVAILIVCILIFINKKHNNYIRPDYGYIALINHSEMLGIDSGTQYTYYIYESSNNEYFYIKSKSNITIFGSGKSNDVDSGKIENINDFKKIKEDIQKDSKEDGETYISYSYINNGNNEQINSIDELAKRLFK